MNNILFERWCRDATSQIRFTPDRNTVRKELMAHLEDHRDALMEQGLPEEAAQKEALNAMGSPWDVAPRLAQVHPPFWGYAYRVTKITAIALCLLVILTVGCYFSNIYNHVQGNYILSPDSSQEWEILSKFQPDAQVYTDGYWIRIPEAILWEKEDGQRRLYFDLQAFYPPWQNNLNCSSWFWAVDNLGNHYPSYQDTESVEPPHVSMGQTSLTSGVITNKMFIHDIPSENLQWIELHYDRDGRDLVLRIDLTGGEAP